MKLGKMKLRHAVENCIFEVSVIFNEIFTICNDQIKDRRDG